MVSALNGSHNFRQNRVRRDLPVYRNAWIRFGQINQGRCWFDSSDMLMIDVNQLAAPTSLRGAVDYRRGDIAELYTKQLDLKLW